MKKLLCVLLSCLMISALTACGGEEEVKDAAVGTIEQNGVTVTMRFDAAGDKITKITQESVVPIDGYTEEQIQAFRDAIEDATAAYEDIENVDYSWEETDTELTETIVIPTDKETLKAVIDAGLLPVSGDNVTELSLEQTKEGLENSGWTFE
nr:DUF1307 domain-containing protein [uncultured Merdimonas sp.]